MNRDRADWRRRERAVQRVRDDINSLLDELEDELRRIEDQQRELGTNGPPDPGT